MPSTAMLQGMRWFKQQFGAAIETAVAPTPLNLNLLTAIAVQETYGEVWGALYGSRPVADVLNLCVGDTLDAPRRRAFPQDKAALLAWPQGDQMFAIARQALEELGKVNHVFGKIAVAQPDKFCHAFGIFQYDLQNFKKNPDYFLQRKWADFPSCLALCVSELTQAAETLYVKNCPSLDHDESVYCAIAYNTGKADLNSDFKQGYKDPDGIYYGEYIDRFLQLAESAAA